MAIQGAIFSAILVIYFWSKKHVVSFWQISDWLAPALALGQFLGRWGNYFNQELYGLPTKMYLGIPIEYKNRVVGFEQFTHFQPTFFYESFLNLLSFFGLVFLINKKVKTGLVTLWYLANYSLIRFFLEFVRIDPSPSLGSWRLPQVVSALVLFTVILCIFFVYKRPLPKPNK